ncbi:MAG: hypothetical protein ABIQ90_10110 [Polaromonas sp.]
MKANRLIRRTRQVLTVIPMTLALLTGATLLMATSTSAIAQTALQPQPTTSTVQIVIAGTVPGPPEDVVFNKAQVQVGSTLIPADPTDPTSVKKLKLDFTFIKAAGVGKTTKAKYIASDKVTVTRDFSGTMVVKITFSFVQDKHPLTEARYGLATFNLTFDTNGVITGASGAISGVPAI